MTTEIGNLSVRIGADTSGLEQGIDRATKATGRYRDASGRLREANGRFVAGAKKAGDQASKTAASFDHLTAISRRLAGVLGAIGIGVGFTQAIRELSNFQAAMNGLAAVSGATAEQMAKLEQQSRSLGATSQFSAQQAGEAQRFLAQAGFEVNEILGATPGILQLATAGSLDLASAADIASNVLGGMRMEVGELNRINDVLAATAARSNTTIEQLGQALSFAAPFAASAGVSIEELAAAIGVMSDAGIQASRAGTGMVGVIRQLSRITSTGEAVLARYGLSMEDVSIEARGLGPVLETLRAANLDTAAAIELFGSEAGAAAQVLVSDYKGAIEDATGEADRMAKQLDQGLGPAFKSLQSAISESVLQMGDSGLAGALENLVRTSTGVISVWNGMGDEWAEANDASDTLRMTVDGLAVAIQTMAAVAAGRGVQALGSYTAAKLAANGATLTLTGSITALRTAMMSLFGPVGIIAGAATLIYQFRGELGLVPEAARPVSEHVDEITRSLDGMNDAMLDLQVAAFGAELLQIGIQAEGVASRIETLRRTASEPYSFGQGQQGDLNAGLAEAEAQQEALLNRAEAIREVLGDINTLRRGERESPTDPSDPETPPGISPFDPGEEEEKQREELERLREHLANRLEVIRESLMSEGELETNRYLEKMEQLHEAREMELIGEEEHQEMMRELAEQHHDKLNDIEQRAADERARIQQQEAQARSKVVNGMMNNLVSLMNSGSKEMFQIGKVAAVAQALLAGREAIVNSYNAGARIGGPPVGAAFAATAAAATAAQIASVKNTTFGGGAVTGGRTGGGGTGAISEGPVQPQQQQAPIGGTLTVEGISSSALFSGDAVRELANELIEFQRRGGSITIA